MTESNTTIHRLPLLARQVWLIGVEDVHVVCLTSQGSITYPNIIVAQTQATLVESLWFLNLSANLTCDARGSPGLFSQQYLRASFICKCGFPCTRYDKHSTETIYRFHAHVYLSTHVKRPLTE